MTLTVGSLFTGVGGFDRGFERAGFEVAWQVEIDKDAVSVLERHYPDTLRVRDVREAGAHNLTPVDVITFGSPCQGFSVAGRGEGLEDERSGLFSEAVRIVNELRPALAVWENVPGSYTANSGRDFGAVLASLAQSRALDIAWRVLDALGFGVPQQRRRVFLVADFGGERAGQVLFEPDGSAGSFEESGEDPSDPSALIDDGLGETGGLISLNWQGVQCDWHLNKIGTLNTSRIPAVSDGKNIRRLTPVECERAMGWPDDWTRYRADGSEIHDWPRHRLIGNGVATPVAYWIARRLHAALEAS